MNNQRFCSLLDWNAINWADIIINTILSVVVSVIVALILKHFIIEDLNRIHNKNRIGMIQGLLSETYRIDNIMKSVFAIIEEKTDFTPNHGCTLLSLTDGEKNRLRYYYDQIHKIFESMKQFKDWKSHMTYTESLAIANYANYSDQFMEFLIRNIPEYFPEMLSVRKKYALEIIDLLDDFVTGEFKDAWKKIS